MVNGVSRRTYRLVVEGELSDPLAPKLNATALTRANGNTTLTVAVRDQAELQGLFQRVSDLGLTLLEAVATDVLHGELSAGAATGGRRRG